MKLSVIIPCMNDADVLSITLPFFLQECEHGECEIIIIDNGSYREVVHLDDRIRIIRNEINIGVGGAFNQGVELAKAANIVLTGPDVIPQFGWYNRVISTLLDRPSTIYNSVCSSWDPDDQDVEPFRVKRYGANLLYYVTKEDIAPDSKLQEEPAFSKILQAKWNYEPPTTEEFSAIQCLYGAFYWMRKKDFQAIHGWNGHRRWGSLEPMLSIKARAYGMTLLVDKNMNTAHYFGRKVNRSVRMDLQYYNMLFMAHTMFSDALRDDLIEYLRYGDRENRIEKLNVNQGRLLIKRAHGLVKMERHYNNYRFKHGLIKNWDKFNQI